jgi:hypothetical protein
MISVLLLDLGDTLVAKGSVLPHVPEALSAIAQFKTGTGKPLRSALVSDYDGPLEDYVKLLDGFGLRRFFEPVDERVTLSSIAGARKPERKIFEKALERLQSKVPFSECLFITEDRGRVAACRQFGMKALRFDSDGTGGDFADWSEGPLLIAHLIAPEREDTIAEALKVRLPVIYDVRLAGITDLAPNGVNAQVLTGGLPVRAKIAFDSEGRIRDMNIETPSAEMTAEQAHYVEGLRANRQIEDGEENVLGTTHRVELDKQGRPVLKRKRYSLL